MATLAENFLADLDELSDGEQEQQQQDKEEEKGNGDDKVRIVFFFNARRALSLSVFFSPPGEYVERSLFFLQPCLKTLTKVKHAHEKND